MGAVIDQKAFTKISGYLDDAKKNAKVIAGRHREGRRGLLHRADADRDRAIPAIACCARRSSARSSPPTSIPTTKWRRDARVVDRTSPYALTGAVFARDRAAVRQAMSALRNAAGNFYINDKPTGAVVGQQPFGGARGSGTNDKAGSKLNLVRWVSARTVKETFAPPRDYTYPFMAENRSTMQWHDWRRMLTHDARLSGTSICMSHRARTCCSMRLAVPRRAHRSAHRRTRDAGGGRCGGLR